MKIKDFLKRVYFKDVNKQDDDIYRNEVFSQNLRGWKLFLWIVTPLGIFHIISFKLGLDPADLQTYSWRKGIITMHTILLIVSLSFGLYAYLRDRKKDKPYTIELWLPFIFNAILLITGAAIAAIDQKVTNAVTPFLLVAVVLAIIFRTKPWQIAILAMIGYLGYFVLMSGSQSHPDILKSNLVNGVTIIAIYAGLSYILWATQMTRYRQSRLILKQTIELEKLNAAKDRFLSIIGHDLTGPLGGISSYLEILEEDLTEARPDDHHLKNTMQRLRSSVNNTLRLVENLLTWSRAQGKELTFNPALINISELISAAAEQIQIQATHKNIRIILPERTEDIHIKADPNMISAIFRNLLSNAVKFSHPGSEVILVCEKTESIMRISVKDTGVGIPPHYISKLFRVDEKITSYGTMNEPGTGLGLILCQEFVTLHGGKIKVVSEKGLGSTFTVELPIK